ncbi:MAG: hypothetical protein QOG29_1386, partial [Gaiellaceae bacterium]|nr:hypothetical protein [Gaiellaceae bacterium]
LVQLEAAQATVAGGSLELDPPRL